MNKFLLVNGIILSGVMGGALVSKFGAKKKAEATSVQACKIKGNRNSKGELIYHIPEGRFYNVTKAVEWFDSEQAAIEAGYRKSER
ncbi:hypothetical protein AB685_06965 [Bacillus sp. LL01]|uniref:sunset domain-containing protein n=1 Tax=Bacillus sp. LL01 TaxID=1665556 RepID=UPI00064D600B|nr:hypothetical protein AB685_06965 [Bacillus sp. LL01]